LRNQDQILTTMPWAATEKSDLLRQRFRAIFSGLALADLVASRQGFGAGKGPSPWPPLMIELATALIAGQSHPDHRWLANLKDTVADDHGRLLLIALPVVLVNVNRYGHRQAALQQWGEDLGLPTTAVVELGNLFSVLCQVMGSTPHCLPEPSAGDGSGAISGLGAGLTVVNRTQSNYALAIQLAQQQHLGNVQIGLVGLLAGATGGVAGLPLAWRQAIDPPQSAAWIERWPDQTEASLWHLADGLYDRWIGGPPPAARARQSTGNFLPITG
jgi:hypothetical protein